MNAVHLEGYNSNYVIKTLSRMQRKKGQFASSRPTQEEGAVVPNWDGTQAPGQPLGPGGVQPEVTYVFFMAFGACDLFNFLSELFLQGSLAQRSSSDYSNVIMQEMMLRGLCNQGVLLTCCFYVWQVCTLWNWRAVHSNDATRTCWASHTLQCLWSYVG